MRFSIKPGVRYSLIVAAALLFSGQAQAAQSYVLDGGHTDIRFGWNHAGVSDQSGRFDGFEGTLTIDPANISGAQLDVTIQADSVNTGVSKLDDHLESADFFNASAHPKITFKSTSVKQSGRESAQVTGDLTINGVTKPVTLSVDLVHQGKHPLGQFIDYYKGEWLGFKATGSILRSDFGVGKYAPLTSDRITIEINTEMKAK